MAKRPSKIDALPDHVKSYIGELRRKGHTLDSILAHLRLIEVDDVSRSGLGRHVQKMEVISQRMAQSRDLATSLVDKFGAEPDNRLARLNLEMMHSIMLDVMTAVQVNPETGETSSVSFDAEQAMFLARALQSLASAQKTDQDRAIKMEEEIKKQAAKAAEGVAKRRGLDAETIKDIRETVLGMRV